MVKSLLVISTYPPQASTYAHKGSAVASYTKNTLTWIKFHKKNLNFTVLADQLVNQPAIEIQDGVTVDRCWQQSSWRSLPRLIQKIRQNSQAEMILFPFEWSMFGSNRMFTSFGPLLLLILKLMRKKVLFVSHGVILHSSEIADQIGTQGKSVKIKVLDACLFLYYFLVVHLAYKTVVFEQQLKTILTNSVGGDNKIVVIPHGVDMMSVGKLVQDSNHKQKKPFTALMFGYLIWYKGTDKAVSLMRRLVAKDPDTPWQLVLAGGESINYRNDSSYRKYVESIYNDAKASKGKITITGFVEPEAIGDYLSQADLMLFPYRAFVSSSGPLSLAFSAGKPVLMDKTLAPYSQTADFRRAMTEANLDEAEIFCLSDEADLATIFNRFSTDNNYRERLTQFSISMRDFRSWEKMGKLYSQLLTE